MSAGIYAGVIATQEFALGVSRLGTDGSNPSPSSGESVANLWHNRKTLDQDEIRTASPSRERVGLPEGGTARSIRPFGFLKPIFSCGLRTIPSRRPGP